jgi:hypothetical protein
MVAAASRQDPTSAVYAYADGASHAALLVQVMFGTTDLTETTRGMRHGLEESAAGANTKLDWLRDETKDGVGHLHAVMTATHVQIETHALSKAIVAITVIGPDAATLSDVLVSFRPEP